MHPDVSRKCLSRSLPHTVFSSHCLGCALRVQVDSYAVYAASAIAGVTSFRALAGFGFPLFADKIYGKLGNGILFYFTARFSYRYTVLTSSSGWGNTILALVCLVIGCPAPFVFYKYGPALRARGQGA